MNKKKIILIFSILIILFISEMLFSYVEIVLGIFIEFTNSSRPQTGAVWEFTQKNVDASQQLGEITQNIKTSQDSITIDNIRHLNLLLDELETVTISPHQFLKLYNMLSPLAAQAIIQPFNLLRLLNSNKWNATKIMKGTNSLNVFFLDADKQLIMDSYPDFNTIFQSSASTGDKLVSLNSMSKFRGRIFSSQQFFRAFFNLPDQIKRQLISNPFLLIKWYDKIQSVAISRYIQDYTVSIGFEVFDGLENQIHTFEASELAIGYLISQLNSLYPELNLENPGL